MDLEEPSEKLDVFTRGQKENEAENEDDSTKDDMKKDKGERRRTRVVYSRNDLNELRDSPASKLWPAFAEEECVRNGVWDPELWHHTPASAKRCASPLDDFKRQILIEDGIVLSPQRQSFGQGCHVHQSAPERGSQQERTKSAISRSIERDTRDGRSRLTGRVGRGSRSLDYRPNLRDRNRNGDRQTSPWDRGDKEIKRNRDDESYSYKRGRRPHDDDEDPEWMTFGPSSISETIELRGFNKENIAKQRGKTSSVTGSNGTPSPNTIKDKNLKNKQEQEKQPTTNEGSKENKDEQDDGADFDINQFFTSDSFLQFAEEPEQTNSNESRFCQFFGIGGKRGSQNGSRRSSGAEELLAYSGVSTPSTPHTPSPTQNFMFTPIKPVEANTKPESLSEMLEKTKLDVKPLLDTVLSSAKRDEMRIKGLKRLEEIEPSLHVNGDDPKREETGKGVVEKGFGDMTAFTKLIEEMKTSGNLPEKPQPVIPGLPSHLLPRPPSPKTKTPRRSPSPLKDLDRSTSPVEFLHHIIQKQQSQSPPQVVPQMNRPYSPLGTPLLKPAEKLQRSPSPLLSMYEQKPFSPLLAPDAFTSPGPVQPPYIHNRLNHMMYHVPDKSQYELPSQKSHSTFTDKTQTPRSAHFSKPKVTPKTQSAVLKDLGFMPTSVLQKIKKDQMTPKSRADENREKEVVNISFETMKMNGELNEEPRKHSVPIGLTSPEPKQGIMSPKDDQLLLKPTAFKPYPGKSPHSVSPHRSGVHSEPQSPQVHHIEHRKDPLPSSAPATPQRLPITEQQLLANLKAKAKEVTNEKPINFPRSSESVQVQKHVPQPMVTSNSFDRLPTSNNVQFGNDIMMNHAKRDFERPMPLPHSVHHHHHHQLQQQQLQQQQQQQQQQMRRENMQYIANLGRSRQTRPLSMIGEHSQSILGTPGMPRTPFPLTSMHQGKPHLHPGLLPSQSLHPGNFRMMPPTRTPSGLPMQSPTALMQMIPQRHPMMYRHGHTPLHRHPGYHQMMTTHSNFSAMPRPHPGFVQPKIASNVPTPEHNARRSPINENGLSKWFSDDVLRGMQSTTSKIPTDIGSKKIVSVEDLERQQTLCTS